MRAAVTAPGPVMLEYGPDWSFRMPILTGGLDCATATVTQLAAHNANNGSNFPNFMGVS